PGLLPALPFLHPAQQQHIHEKLTRLMMKVSGRKADPEASQTIDQIIDRTAIFTPLVLGLLWGLIPCGFLYAGQLRAAETQSWTGGAMIMLMFGLGTLPAMLAMGAATSWLSRDQRSQLFRIGGWLTVLIGTLLLWRTGDTMSDYSGHGALICLMLALIARPISRLWAAPLRYRRLLGVSAFVLALLHVIHMASHTWNWHFQAVRFMLREQQFGVLLGAIALLLLLPAALTSFDGAYKRLGNRWRKLHLLSLPALLLAAAHTIIIGSSYWGPLMLRWPNQVRAVGLLAAVVMVLGVRSPYIWSLLSLKNYYALPKSSLQNSSPDASNGCHADLPAAQPDSR
ncbi:MAG: sulfite exporter TauE/SafE family protein, partial [Phormidesmis sp.]